MVEKITKSEYTSLQTAFDYFNEYLFGGTLPECLITFQTHHSKAIGFYRPKHFKKRVDGKIYTDEIALNPDWFSGKTNEDILSTLVHEMVHLWQYHFGKPSRMGYHNKQWAYKMLEIGLKPKCNNDIEKIVGQSMGHEIIKNGLFQIVAQKFLKKHSAPNWESVNGFDLLELLINLVGGDPTVTPKPRRKKKDKSKVKFTCPTSSCGQNAWAKETAVLMCGICEITMLANE
jgi:hypothetical protein